MPDNDPADAVGEHPDAAPPLQTELEAMEATAAAVREMTAEPEEEEPPEEPKAELEAEPEPEPEAQTEDDDKPSRVRALDDKPSRVREARRRQRAARRAHEEAQRLHQETQERLTRIEVREAEHAKWEQDLRRDPLGAVARRLQLTPEQLLGSYADGKVQEVPASVQAQIDALQSELSQHKESLAKRDAELEEAKQRDAFERSVQQDVDQLVGVSERDDAERFPYFASLPSAERASRARAAVLYTVRHMPDPGSYRHEDILEALDEQAKSVYASLVSSKFLASRTGATDKGPAPSTGRRRKARAPSSKAASAPAAKAQPQTEQDLREAAAREVRELMRR